MKPAQTAELGGLRYTMLDAPALDDDGRVITMGHASVEDIAYWLHCESGQHPLALLAKIIEQVLLLEEIDPDCAN